MTPDQLKLPRYRVVADYPESRYPIGLTTDHRGFYTHTDRFEPEKQWSGYIDMRLLNGYPSIFKKLKWWEERELKDLPEYVQATDSPSSLRPDGFYKVREWAEWPEGPDVHGGSPFFCRLEGWDDYYRFSVNHFIPATQEEAVF